MKKTLKVLGFASLMIVAGSVAAFAVPAAGVAGDSGLCDLVEKMQGVFKILRTLAFVGAAFVIADWAWGYISKGDVTKEDIKTKGTGLLVGFVLLFAIGIVLQFLFISSAGKDALGCVVEGWN